jgi:hypothetical protein
VDEERSHRHDTSSGGETVNSMRLLRHLADLLVRENPTLMGAWQKTQGSVQAGRVVEMNTQRHDSLQDRGGSMGVKHSALY